MAKNRNRDRSKPQAADRAATATSPAAEKMSESEQARFTAPEPTAHGKRQKRFGHN
ncbi:hypothetical protein [Streptomyces fuscigenes]|uniref:hypothetical protein n=1 Tax=Streptomyces fuscigenes TaxID=1528880 RepID=UPI001F2C7B01|nr:hypothetical protein [Streptomyces fuscigenes]MCF3963675.1 hypothetical protein [Streptomyces fuscigenes]